MKGCHESQLPSYLNEFMWRERHGSAANVAMDNIVRDNSRSILSVVGCSLLLFVFYPFRCSFFYPVLFTVPLYSL